MHTVPQPAGSSGWLCSLMHRSRSTHEDRLPVLLVPLPVHARHHLLRHLLGRHARLARQRRRIEQPAQHRRLHRARRDRERPHPDRRALLGATPCHQIQPRLARGIGEEPGKRIQRPQRRDVDHAMPARRHALLGKLPAEHHPRRGDRARRPDGVGKERLLNQLRIGLIDRLQRRDPRVVHQHIQPPEPPEARRHHHVPACRVRHIRGHAQRLAPLGQRRRGLLERIGPPSDQHHAIPRRTELPRHRAPDPRPRARHQSHRRNLLAHASIVPSPFRAMVLHSQIQGRWVHALSHPPDAR